MGDDIDIIYYYSMKDPKIVHIPHTYNYNMILFNVLRCDVSKMNVPIDRSSHFQNGTRGAFH